MRAFVAVAVPPPQLPDLAPGRAEDHITLHFFPDLREEEFPRCVQALEESADAERPFAIQLRGIGAFPSPRRPRVVWVGVGEGAPPLRALVDRLRRALAERNFVVEARPFVPHVTLFRVRTAADAALARSLLEEDTNPEGFGRGEVAELLLKESRLTPRGAVHAVRVRAPLRGTKEPPPSVP